MARRLAVFGGTGFVGQRVCAEAVKHGHTVISVSRSGLKSVAAAVQSEAWVGSVDWRQGDVGDAATLGEVLRDVDAVVIAVGSPPLPQRTAAASEWQRGANANATLVEAIRAHGNISRVVGVSAAMPRWVATGYRQGKLEMEASIEDIVASGSSGSTEDKEGKDDKEGKAGGVVLRPGGVYGTRYASGYAIPLWVVMTPMSRVMQLLSGPLGMLARAAPSVFEGLVPPVDVEAVARAAVRGATDPEYDGVYTIIENDALLKS